MKCIRGLHLVHEPVKRNKFSMREVWENKKANKNLGLGCFCILFLHLLLPLALLVIQQLLRH